MLRLNLVRYWVLFPINERYESTEVYLKVFALDVAPQLGVTFSLDHRDYSHLLTRK